VSNALFPRLRGLTWDVKKRPQWGTIIQTATSGREVRLTNRAYPIWEFEIAFDQLLDMQSGIAIAGPSSVSPAVAAAGNLPATTYYLQATWVGSFGESLPCPENTQAATASEVLTGVAPNGTPPAGATGWNVYVGAWSGGECLQNATPIGLSATWGEPTTGLIAGLPPPQPYTDFDLLNGFYGARQGAFDSFLLYDPTDNLAANVLIGTGDGTTTQFPLVANLGPLVQLQQNPIYPVAISVAGTPVTSGYSFGAPGTNGAGVVTFASAPASGHAITVPQYSYFYRVRFLRDEIEFNEFMQQRWELEQLELISVKL
jgi:hypothetical protein